MQIKNIIELELGYLNLNRSITSLSGGELQRLQLSELLNSKFVELLIILDEPLSGLHYTEKKVILDKINLLKEDNTLILIDHDERILRNADNITALGPEGGIHGGCIIDEKEYIKSQNKYKEKILGFKRDKASRKKGVIKIKNEELIYNFKPCDIEIPVNKLIGVSGYSGTGKSIFLKYVLPKNLPNYKYISQEPILGNIYSTVGSYLDILSNIRNLFAKENNMSQSLFSYHFSGDGKCTFCNGTGEVKLDSYGMVGITNLCPECNGGRFDKNVLKYKYKGLNISEFLNSTIDELLEILDEHFEKQLISILTNAKKLNLGHLKLMQKISTLSGGENQRIKTLSNLNSSNTFIGLDEPFKGLDNKNIYNLLKFFKYLIKERQWTIIFIEHNILPLSVCEYLIDIGPEGGEKGGNIIYSGLIEDIKYSSNVSIYNYLY